MVKDTILSIMDNIWPMLCIVTVIAISIRIAYLITSKKKIVLYEELISLCFILYVLLLFYIVTFQDVNYGTNNFIPFKEMFRYSIGSPLFYKNVIGNILLFAPLGFFISRYLKAKKYLIVFILSLIVSLSIEFVQLKIGRVFDIDDIILNLIGSFIGYLSFIGLNAISNRMPKFFKSNAFLNIVIILIIAIIVLNMINFNFWGLLN